MKAALLSLIAFVAGIGLGYLLGNENDARGRASGPPATSEPKPATAPPAPVQENWQGALDSVEIPEPAHGDGVISGRVVSDEGDPLVDVLVLAVPQRYIPTTRDWKGSYDSSLDERVREFTKVEKWRDASMEETRTGADGRYRLTGLGREPYSVNARGDGYRFDAIPRRHFSVNPDATVDFVAHAVVRLRIDVVGPDGTPVQRAVIRSSNRRPPGGILAKSG